MHIQNERGFFQALRQRRSRQDQQNGLWSDKNYFFAYATNEASDFIADFIADFIEDFVDSFTYSSHFIDIFITNFIADFVNAFVACLGTSNNGIDVIFFPTKTTNLTVRAISLVFVRIGFISIIFACALKIIRLLLSFRWLMKLETANFAPHNKSRIKRQIVFHYLLSVFKRRDIP